MKLITYLTFEGNAHQVMKYYQKILKGEITNVQKYGDVEDDGLSIDIKDYLIHGRLECDGFDIYFSDSYKKVDVGNNVSLSLQFDNIKDITRVYDLFEKDAKKIIVKIGDSFWDSKYGCLVDKYGIVWQLNCQY